MQLYIHKNKYWCRYFWSAELVYTLRLIALFDAAETAIIDDNEWWGSELYLSQDKLDRLYELEAIAAEQIAIEPPENLLNSVGWTNALFAAGGQALWKGVRLAHKRGQADKAYEITVGDLTRGVDLEGDLDEITSTERLLMTSVTALAAKLDSASGFYGGTTIVPIGRQPALVPPKQPRRIA
jgi:hypothetical protein